LKRPLLVGAISYIIGILWGLYFFEISIVLIFCVSVFFVFNKFKINKLTVILVVVAILVGFFYMAYSNKYYINKITNLKQSTNWIEVQIISITKEHDYTNSYEARFKDRTKVILYIPKSKDIKLSYGDIIKVKGEFSEASHIRNYKGFSYKNYLKSQGVFGSIDVSCVEIKKKENINIILKYFHKIRSKIIYNMNYIFENKKEAGIALGMIIGDDNFLEDQIEKGFKKSSLTHILCVSGANMAYIIAMCLFIFKKIKISKRIAYYFCIFCICLFMLLTGMDSASVVRAGIMGIIMLLSKIFYRKLDIYNSIALSVIIILLNNPFAILDIGFLLSIFATLRNCFNISET